MRKLEALSPWPFFCLGVVLLGVSILVVPQTAFAQGGGSCSVVCCDGCYGTGTCDYSGSCYTACYGGCNSCVTECAGNQSCIDMCYATWYNQEVNCMNDCQNLLVCYMPEPNCSGTNAGCNANVGCGNCRCLQDNQNSGLCTCYFIP